MTTHIILSRTQKYCLIFTLTLALTLIWTTIARAEGPGDLDITFGGTGIVTDSISSGQDGGWAVALQPDGKIVVAGVSNGDGFNSDFAVIRYNSDGSRDTTFNSTGVVTTPINDVSWGFGTTIQPDGKILAVGNSGRILGGGSFDYAFATARYYITGTLDTNFNNTGVVTTSIDDDTERGWSVVVQPDGKIVVTGEIEAFSGPPDRYLAVMRYNITGTLDTKFNNTGIVTTSLVGGGKSDVVIQPDGNIIVASGGLVRYTSTGTLDTSFNGTGIVTTPGFSANALKFQPDNKIVAAGNSFGGDFSIARYNSDGSLDTTFNGTGIVTTPITSDSDGGLSVAIQPNGKIVVAGSSGSITGDEGDIAVVRYNNNGSLDTTFGNAGIVTTSVSSTSDAAWGVAIQSDGKIVAAGFSDAGTDNTTFAVVRYLGDPPLTLTKSVGDSTPKPGQLITYTLSISNSGSFSTTNLLISDTLPLSLTLAETVTLEPPQVGAILATSPLSLPTIASSVTISPMAAITVTIPVTVGAGLSAGMQLTNTATMTSPEMSISVSDVVVIAIASGASDKVYLPVILKN